MDERKTGSRCCIGIRYLWLQKNNCVNNQCSCKVVGLPCTGCKNDNKEIDFDDESDVEDDENEDDDEVNENFVSDDELDYETDFTDSDTDEEC